MALTKADIGNSIKRQFSFTKNQSVETIETLLEIMKKTLESGEDILISGFGKFGVKEKTERRGRNPATGVPCEIKPKKLPFFKCGKELKERVNG
ncbi:integration host factor subunit alpha [Thermodesulfobacteriota bacterium]